MHYRLFLDFQIFGILGIVIVIMVLYGGFEWLTAMGREEKVTKGKDTLIWAAIGAVVISIAWTITTAILTASTRIGA